MSTERVSWTTREMTRGHGYLNIKGMDSSGWFPRSFCVLLVSKHCSQSVIRRKPQLLPLGFFFFSLSKIRFGECAKSTCNFYRETLVWVSTGNQIFWGNPFCTTLRPDNEAIVKVDGFFLMERIQLFKLLVGYSWPRCLSKAYVILWKTLQAESNDFYFLNNYHSCIPQLLQRPTLRYLIYFMCTLLWNART